MIESIKRAIYLSSLYNRTMTQFQSVFKYDKKHTMKVRLPIESLTLLTKCYTLGITTPDDLMVAINSNYVAPDIKD